MQYAKTSEGKWLLTEYESEDAVIRLSSIDLEISLKDIYKRVNFEAGEEE
jgi:Uma2 family endonuclease